MSSSTPVVMTPDEISQWIWSQKHAHTPTETMAQGFRRVAEAVMDTPEEAVEMHQIFMDKLFYPGGRIIANAGSGRVNSTMSNCFAMPSVPDSMSGIFDTLKDGAMTQKFGGGVGYDFSLLRPAGQPVKGIEGSASGPVSFMHVFDTSCSTIMVAGQRRGAQIAVLRCDHPDIRKFIRAKSDSNGLKNFNLSVGITDAFMMAVQKQEQWNLIFDGKIYETVNAVELWEEILKHTYDYAEPGVLFLDTVNNGNNLQYCEHITAVNPCIAGDTWILTSEGAVHAADLIGKQFTALVDGTAYKSDARGVWCNGTRSTIIITTVSGYSIRCTPDHLFMNADTDEWTPAGQFKNGMYVRVHNHHPHSAVSYCGDRILDILPGGDCLVYDASIPGINVFDANGFYAHNCGEQPLPPYGACILGSFLLPSFVQAAFQSNSGVGFTKLIRTVSLVVKFMDRVLDICPFPLEAQKKEAQTKRRIGLGITGLADALCMLNLKYGSEQGRFCAAEIMRVITEAAYNRSVSLAIEAVPFPLYEARYQPKVLLTVGTRAEIEAHGIRNSHLTSIAPTGTMSLLAGNLSSGVEPIFAVDTIRTIKTPTGEIQRQLTDYAVWKYREMTGDPKSLPPALQTVNDLTVEDHLLMLKALQPHIDSAISKTVNVPTDYPFDDFKKVYQKAWEYGLKGITTYRPNPGLSAVLTDACAAQKDKAVEKKEVAPVVSDEPVERPPVLSGKTYKIRDGNGTAYYVTINDLQGDDGKLRPFETFINTKSKTHLWGLMAIGRLLSSVFRREKDPEFIVEELGSIYDPAGNGYWQGGKYIDSIVSHIGQIIEQHLEDLKKGRKSSKKAEKKAELVQTQVRGEVCPACQQFTAYRQEGCLKCTSCSYSKCG